MIIGFTAIDLGVLLTGTATITGWYNIIDFSGRINGQIKVQKLGLRHPYQFSELRKLPISGQYSAKRRSRPISANH